MGIKTIKAILVLTMLSTLSITFAKPYSDIIKLHSSLLDQLSTFNITERDLKDSVIVDHYVTKHNGVTHLVLKQYLNGIEVYQGDIQVNIDKNGNQLNMHNNFIADLSSKANITSPIIPADLAILNAAASVNIKTTILSFMLSNTGSQNKSSMYSGEGISLKDIPVKLSYQKVDNQAILAWDLQIQTTTDWWNIRVDASTGKVLDTVNWSAHASYDVIPLPHESPATNGFQLETETDPHNLTASPFGWHDTDGTSGAEFTDTRGNNVYAQDDLDANNSGGSRPDGGSGLIFNVPWNPAVNPNEEENLDSAIVNLFYWNNIIHDVMYQYGFDEVAGNFQQNNYGNGGLGNDQVIADAQDGSGTNNANFGTPPDGFTPRMQMYYYNAPPGLFVTTPASIAGEYPAGGASFGAAYTQAGITGELELVNDGTGASNTDACEPLVGFTANKIALLDRGGCEFGIKVLNAENAGAIGAIVVNNAGDGVITMGPGVNGGSVTITAIMVGQGNGDVLKNELGNTVTVEIKKSAIDRDSDFDNGIIVHEYGHGISNRLTGGPAASGCLQNQEQMGEGWSDFFATVMTAQPTDIATTQRPMGTYATQNPGGIRPFPYTTDMAVNPTTLASLPTVSVPHGVGSVWTQMLWEVYWNLVDKYGYDADLYNGTGGNNLALQLVMDGLKLQPCSPGFESGRDAILLADQTNNAGANQCEIWEGFAKRGLGEGASSGSTNTIGDETESFIIPEFCTLFPEILVTKTAVLTTDNGHQGEADEGDVITFSVTVENTGNVDLTALVVMDSMEGLLSCASTSLLPTEIATCTDYTYTVVALDVVNGGTIDNIVDVTMKDPGNNDVVGNASTQTVINQSMFKDGFE